MKNMLLILVMSFSITIVEATENLPNAPDNPAMAEAAKNAAQLQQSVSPEAAADLDSVIQYTRSAEFQAKQDQAKSEIMGLLGVVEAVVDDTEKRPDKRQPHRAVIFISSSIPVDTLRNYAADLEKIDGVMVLRGLVNGMKNIGPTAEFIASVLRVDPACKGPQCVMRRTNVIVDPLLFRANGINQVPAFAFQPNMEFETYCSRDAGDEIPTSRAIIYGDAALSGLIDEYARLTKDARVKIFLKELNNG